jgi:hypothetical protein
MIEHTGSAVFDELLIQQKISKMLGGGGEGA